MPRFAFGLATSLLRQTFLINQRRLFSDAAKKSFYEVLGIAPSASESDIKKAYLKLAKKYHPDVCKEADASKKFQEVSEAYEILSDKTKRREYDTFQTGGFQQGFDSRGMRDTDDGFNFHSTRSANDIFEEIFGKGFKFSETSHGFDASQEISVRITFEESARGVQKSINVNVIDSCDSCRGSGVTMGYKKVSCTYCNGTGMVTKKLSGFFMQSTCGHCRGTGMFNKNPCLDCEGTGNVVKDRATSIYIPPGIDNDQTLRMQIGYSTIYVRVQVTPSLIHKRVRDNIHTDVEISIADAVLGTRISVPGIESDTNIEIPAGTSSHAQFCLKNKGMKRLNNAGFGDQFVNIKIGIPKNPTVRQRELMAEWRELDPKKAQAKK